MKFRIVVFIALLQVVHLFVHGGNNDSLFFDGVKKFAFKEMGMELEGDLFTKWKGDDNPYYYIYFSQIDKVANARVKTDDAFIICKTEQEAIDLGNNFNTNYATWFIYKTYMNSDCLLNKRFISYRRESQTFIILHELTHHFIIANDLKFPYEFNEALCDVVGNYGTLKYAQTTKNINEKIARNQTFINEHIFEGFNETIDMINEKVDRAKLPFYEIACHDSTKVLLQWADTFQKDRFDDYVSTAYLLKNYYYCHNFFLLKRVYEKQGSIKKLLDIIKGMPKDVPGCVKYLQGFI